MKEKLPTIHPYDRGKDREHNYFARYRYRGEQHKEPTGAKTLKEFALAKAKIEESIINGTWVPYKLRKNDDAPMLFGAFALDLIDKRAKQGVKTARKDEGGIVRNHLNPEFGSEMLTSVAAYARAAAGFARIREKDIGGATVRNIYAVFRTVMRIAAKRGLIAAAPPPLSVIDGELPPVIERRPEGWREEAVFTIDEIAKLLAAEAIEPQYRCMYVVYFLTGSRFSEVTGVRVSDYVCKKRPLAQLTIRSGKVGRSRGIRYRTPPVHPALAAWLDWWLAEGFEWTHCRPPEASDLMFPTLSPRRQNAGQLNVSHGELYKRWQRYHLPACGLRHRRLHDARRTLLSLVRSSAAPQDVARAITHTVIADKVLDAYTTFEWEAICKAVLSVDWRLPGPPSLATAPAEVIDLQKRRGGAVSP